MTTMDPAAPRRDIIGIAIETEALIADVMQASEELIAARGYSAVVAVEDRTLGNHELTGQAAAELRRRMTGLQPSEHEVDESLVVRAARASVTVPWDELTEEETRDALATAREWLDVMAQAGLTVLDETPETPRLAADVVLLGDRDGQRQVLLIERAHRPFPGQWALPGGHVDKDEPVDTTVRRELTEEAGLSIDQCTLVGVYSAPGRDPRGRVVTWAYLATVAGTPTPEAGDDAKTARWWPLAEVLSRPGMLAFDHHQILTDAAGLVGPEPGTRDLAEKVARAHHAMHYQAKNGWPSWDDSPAPYRVDMLRSAGQWLNAMREASVAVVELPEPDGWVEVVGDDGQDIRTPYWEASYGRSVTAWGGNVEAAGEIEEDLDEVRADALKMLAAVAVCERYRAEHQGGASR